MFRRLLIIFALLATLAFLPACLDEAVKPIKEAPPTTWPEMITEDEVVQALVLCYENPGLADVMARYEGFLHSEYFFELAPDDVDVGESKFILRAEDIASTSWIFENQSGLTSLYHRERKLGGLRGDKRPDMRRLQGDDEELSHPCPVRQ